LVSFIFSSFNVLTALEEKEKEARVVCELIAIERKNEAQKSIFPRRQMAL